MRPGTRPADSHKRWPHRRGMLKRWDSQDELDAAIEGRFDRPVWLIRPNEVRPADLCRASAGAELTPALSPAF